MSEERNVQVLSCRDVTEKANAYIDGELDLWPRTRFRMHLLACKYCRGFVEQMQAADVSVYHYRVIFKPQAIIPDIDARGDAKELTKDRH